MPEIDEVILSLNYQPRRIEEIFGDGSDVGIKIRYVVEPAPLGTAGAVKYAGDKLTESVVVFNGDVLTQIDLAAVIRLHRERKARATIVLTPVENPSAYGLVETDADGNIRRFLEKPKPEEITTNRINAGIYVLEPDTFDRIPSDVAWSIERSYFPSLVERGETFVAYVYDGYWIDIGTPREVHAGASRHHGWSLRGRPVSGRPTARGWPLTRASKRARRSRGRASSTRACSSRLAHASALTRCSASRPRSRRTRARRRHHLAELPDQPRRVGPQCHRRPQLPPRPQRERSTTARCSAIARRSRITRAHRSTGADTLTRRPTCTSTRRIFKAYDIRGLYPGEINEETALAIGRGFVAYLGAGSIGVSRDMRVSSPAIAAAFIEGARQQGANVIDFGMLGTDQLYFAVVERKLEGGAQITASHNPKQYNGVKMVRAEALPLSGDAGIGDIRDMIANDRLPPPAARTRRAHDARHSSPPTSRR